MTTSSAVAQTISPPREETWLPGDSAILEDIPEIDDSLRVLETASGRKLLEEGRAFSVQGDLKAAERKFYEALFCRDQALVFQAHMELGAVCRKNYGRRYEAVAHYRRALSLEPGNLDVLFELAQTGFELAETSGYGLAGRSLLEIILHNPEYREAYELWRKSIRDQGPEELHRLRECLYAWLPSHRKRGYWWLDLAWDSYRLGDIPTAFTCLDSLRVGWPDYKLPDQSLLVARCRLEQGDTVGFEQAYRDAVAYAGRNGGFERLSYDAQSIINPAEKEGWKGVQSTEACAILLRKFWLRRDPDPTDEHNERLVEHYVRLARAEKFYKQLFPHSKFQTSKTYRQLVSGASMNVDYDPGEVIGDLGQALSLDQRGLLFIRHGLPQLINKPDLDKAQNPTEIWQYRNGFFIFERTFGAGDFLFIPSAIPGSGDMKKALATDSFSDPLPVLEHDYYGADFQGPADEVEVEFYQSIPLSAVVEAPSSVVVLFDTTWAEVERDSSLATLVRTPADSFWMAVNRLSHEPGNYIYSAKMCVPGKRAVSSKVLALSSYSDDRLGISGVVLGSSPPEGVKVLERSGVSLLPRPSLRFSPGEIMSVYFEIYGLRADSLGHRSWRERVTVASADESESGVIRWLFMLGGRKRKSLSLSFDRETEEAGRAVPENFVVDTGNLAPGRYRLQLEISDQVGEVRNTTDWLFELVGSATASK